MTAMVQKPTEIMDVLRKLQALDDEIRDIRDGRNALVANMERLHTVLSHLDLSLIHI